MIMYNESTPLETNLDFFWNYNNDYAKLVDFYELPFSAKLHKVVVDITVSIFFNAMNTLSALYYQRNNPKKDELEKFIAENSSSNIKEKNVIVIFQAHWDYNNALTRPLDNYIKLERESGCKIVFKIVRNIDEIKDEIELLNSQNNKIIIVWLKVHGDTKCMVFDLNENGIMNIDDQRDMQQKRNYFENTFNILDREAIIILESCASGRIVQKEINIAQFFAEVAGGRKIFAPTEEIFASSGCDLLTYTKEDGFKVSFKGYADSELFPQGSLLRRLMYCFCYTAKITKDITKVF